MPHDIIDNRTTRLVDRLRDLLPNTEMARFAVGYFFLSGLEAIADTLDEVRELRLLIGNTTNRQTIEQIAEGYRRLEEVREEAEGLLYPKAAERPAMARAAAEAIGETAELMDQTDEAEYLVTTLAQLIEQGRLHVRVYIKGRLHAKAYICSYGPSYSADGRPRPLPTKGIGIVGSSNLSLAGITSNTELNVVVHGDENHTALVGWFDELWEEAEPFEAHLLDVLQRSWAQAEVTPYEIYLKTLYDLVRDRLEAADEAGPFLHEEINAELAEFQRAALGQARAMIDAYGGCFVADVVGLGKTYIGAALLKHYVEAERARPLVICPAPLVNMWEQFSARYDLNARVLSMGMLREDDETGDQWLRDHEVYRYCDLVLIDESHNFRNTESQRYRVLQTYLAANDRKAVLLTATPRNTSARDIYNQIKLFHQSDLTQIPIDPPDLRRFFQLAEEGRRRLPDLLTHILIRRRRRDVLRMYGYDAQTGQRIKLEDWPAYKRGERKAYVIVGGRKQFFPKRHLHTASYSIEDTYSGLYAQIRERISGQAAAFEWARGPWLTYARYGLGSYVLGRHRQQPRYADLARAGRNLRGLMRIMLFKRFESSVEAFRLTIGRMLETHRAYLAALEQGIVPAGDEAEKLLSEADQMDEEPLYEALRSACVRYDAAHFDLEGLMADLRHDIGILQELLEIVAPINAAEDDKLQALRKLLQTAPLQGGKRLIFTQFADTARYLYSNLRDLDPTLEVIYSGDRDPVSVVARFAPQANPERAQVAVGPEINLLVATDVLSEGLNLQDCDRIINYDLHWNPVRLIQRLGRIDRIGSEYDEIHAWNFLPETALEQNLDLTARLQARIQEIHDTIGEDAAILQPSERINEESLYAIYADGSVEDFEDEEDALVDLAEAEETIRRLREEDPVLFDRITTLADGIRCGRRVGERSTYLYCRAGLYRRLYLVDARGDLITSETPRVLRWLRCEPDTPAEPLPPDHNARVMTIKQAFDEEVKQRKAELSHTTRRTPAQRAILRELLAFRLETQEAAMQERADHLQQAFGGQIVRPAIRSELNRLYRNKVTQEALVRELGRIYARYRMDMDASGLRLTEEQEREALPRIICSEAGVA